MSSVWDTNWFGSTKTLDVHIGWLRRKLGDDPAAPHLHRDGARRRLPLRRAGGGGAVSLRATLLLALAYVLLLALIALGVPLALSLRDRVDSEVRGQARSQADVVAATASELLDPVQRARPAAAGAGLGRQRPRPGHRRRRAAAACSPTRPARRPGRSYADRPEVRAALRGHSEQITRNSETLGAEILATAVPVLEHGSPQRRGADHPERRRGQPRGADLDPRRRRAGRASCSRSG